MEYHHIEGNHNTMYMKHDYSLIWESLNEEENDTNTTSDTTSDTTTTTTTTSTCEPDKKKTRYAYCGDTGSHADLIKTADNHIYFYAPVNKKTILKLNTELTRIAKKLYEENKSHPTHQEYIYLHINSFGGSVFAALSCIDTIENLTVPVVSIIEGAAASAATMISVVCDHRLIRSNSFMLIHQLSSSMWGKFDDMEEEMENLKELMKRIKGIYERYTQIPPKDLDEILKHDLWWSADICLEKKLVDGIHKTEKQFTFDENLLLV